MIGTHHFFPASLSIIKARSLSRQWKTPMARGKLPLYTSSGRYLCWL